MKHIFKNKIVRYIIFSFFFLIFLTTGCSFLASVIPATGCQKRGGLKPEIEAAIEEFRASVPAMMKKGNVPGAAIALVDDKGTIWTEGFGYVDRRKRSKVSPETTFQICSVSKMFTALAVMLAVQDGMLNLDEPITTYLPDFKVNSRYEKNPEEKITLRGLLSHTSGLPRETTLGNCFEPEPIVSLKEHVESIYDTWLTYPVGKGCRYSNFGYSLAAYIVQVVSGEPFSQYLKDRIFDPLGMPNSTVDSDDILSYSDRAIAHQDGFVKFPSIYSTTGAIGVYSSVSDLAKFLQLYINKGTIKGKDCILDETLFDAICTPEAIIRKPRVCYGLGIGIERRPHKGGELILSHEGGGFGFASFIHWYPEYNIGMVVITNLYPNPVLFDDLAYTLTDKLIKGKVIKKRFDLPEPEYGNCAHRWDVWTKHNPTPYKPEWSKYCGTYRLKYNGYKLEWWVHLGMALNLGSESEKPHIKIHEKDGFLCLRVSSFFKMLDLDTNRLFDQKLQECRKDLFFTASGETLDFRGNFPMWYNFRFEN